MYTKKCAKFCEVCAHFSLASWYYINRKNPPIHYIVFATPHKKKYLLQKRQLIPLSFLLSENIITVHVIFSNEISASPESGSPKYCDRMNGCAESLNI